MDFLATTLSNRMQQTNIRFELLQQHISVMTKLDDFTFQTIFCTFFRFIETLWIFLFSNFLLVFEQQFRWRIFLDVFFLLCFLLF